MQALLDQKQAIYDQVDGNELFQPGKRKGTLRFINEFFATIERPDRIRRQLIDGCLS